MSTTAHAIGFQPGERVPETGVYRVTHSARHTGSAQVVYESGKKFPLCGTCFWSVRYVLVSQCSPQDFMNLHRTGAKGAR